MPDPREVAQAFLRDTASGKVRSAFASYIAPNFQHHNPYFPGDAAGLANAMEENAKLNPEKTVDILRTIVEGTLVAVHSRIRQRPGDLGAVVVHIFRFEGDRISELWDIGQAIPDDSPNKNGVI